MSTYRLRPQSPPRYRDPHRASTGNVYHTSYEMVPSGHSTRSSVSGISPRASNIAYEAQPIRKTVHPDGKRTEYVVRPRQDSVTSQDVKKPLSISTTKNQSPPHRGPRSSASPRDLVPSGVPREDAGRLLLPSSALVPRQRTSHHQRHASASRADPGSFDPYRDQKQRTHHVREVEPPKQYYVARPKFARQATDEDFSYTGPREQFARDYPIRPRRESNTRRERPANVYESDRETSGRRAQGPPTSSKRLPNHIERVTPARHHMGSGFDSDPDRPNEASRRHQSLRAPAVLHQKHSRDEGYSSSRDDLDPRSRSHKHDDGGRRHSRSHRESIHEPDRDYRRERDRTDDYDHRRDYDHHGKDYHRRAPRSRETSPERSHFKDLATGTLGGLATAGALKALTAKPHNDKDDSDDEEKKSRHRHRRHRKTEDEKHEEPDEYRRSSKREESGSESPEDKPRRRRPSRRHHHDDSEDEIERAADSQRPPRPRSVSRVRTDDDGHARGGYNYGHDQDYNNDYGQAEARRMSPGENEDDRPRRVMLVEPEKKDEVKPKGILKPARQVPFPEDPNPIREGVAPLKDAKKDGVPPGARWTKISRVLVNPEALEKANERFEERDDYVIVLRVISREEIQKLADKTAQIREAREREWEQRLQDRTSRKKRGHDSDRTDTDEDERKPLAIEAPPSEPPMDFRNMTKAPESEPYEAQTIPSRPTNGQASVPDIHVSETYSQNV